jgi:SRSO17 transposase
MMEQMRREYQATIEQTRLWGEGLATVAARIGKQFPRAEPRRRATAYLRGLISPIERKNGWQLAEHAGEEQPYGMQHVLGRAIWSADAVRDDLRTYVVEHLGEPDAVLVVGETGFLKKGTKSVGVARQYSGTAGRVEHCQIGVFLVYATARGRTFLDRELYLPRAGATARPRRTAAGVPETVRFMTKPQLARPMIARALAAGVVKRLPEHAWRRVSCGAGKERRAGVRLGAAALEGSPRGASTLALGQASDRSAHRDGLLRRRRAA